MHCIFNLFSFVSWKTIENKLVYDVGLFYSPMVFNMPIVDKIKKKNSNESKIIF